MPEHTLEPPASWLLLSDIDGTLTGDPASLERLMNLLAAQRRRVAFGVASGRSPALVSQIVLEAGLNEPDLVIAGVGSEIQGPAGLGEAWQQHITQDWQREAIRELLQSVRGLQLQPDEGQSPVKLSYLAAAAAARQARSLLQQARLPATLVHSHGQYLDVLPRRASKGRAVRFVAAQLGLPLEQIVVAGDSGNDTDMLQSGALAAVVSNYDPELEPVLAAGGIYVARQKHAAGVLEALVHFGVLEQPAAGPSGVRAV